MGPACRRDLWRTPSPAGTGVRSPHCVVTSTVDRPPRAVSGRRKPAAAGHAARSRRGSRNIRSRGYGGLTTPASHRSVQVTTCLAARDDASCRWSRWTSYSSLLVPADVNRKSRVAKLRAVKHDKGGVANARVMVQTDAAWSRTPPSTAAQRYAPFAPPRFASRLSRLRHGAPRVACRC